MVILIRFGMNNNCEINARLLHLLQQNLWRSNRIRLVGAIAMVGKFFVFIACKTVDMSIDDGGLFLHCNRLRLRTTNRSKRSDDRLCKVSTGKMVQNKPFYD